MPPAERGARYPPQAADMRTQARGEVYRKRLFGRLRGVCRDWKFGGARRGDVGVRVTNKKNTIHSDGVFLIGETFDWMSELLAIFSISSDVGMLIGLSSKVRISLI